MIRSSDSISQALALDGVATALTQDAQPESGLNALAAALSARIGYRLFTVLVLDRQAGLSRRFYSSQPDAYPTDGAKPIRTDSDFYTQVVEQGRPRICADRGACHAAFPDHERIFALDCESAVNVPVRWDGQTIASLNLLHHAGWYREAMFSELGWYAALAIPVIQKIIHTAR
ncbi:GAF domain-containing protein [Achromobacter animicus]|uniref:GAF domain-containing protein n=1 Tax=Achromobacter animicus TaxID=1389935 RepID=UPI0028AC9AFB|nr:GAF domain-containing protein [Achromobacter animicus]